MNLLRHFLTACCLVGALSAAKAESIPRGFGQIEVGRGREAITVFTYKPRNYHGGPLLLVFHGKQRNAETYCADAAPLADRRGLLVAVPLFDEERFPNDAYSQTGGVLKDNRVQPRNQWTFARVPEIIDAIRKSEHKTDLPVYVFGHSAGGQFAMRLAAIFPVGAERIVAANPGSTLFARRDWPFGYGFGGLPGPLGSDDALKRYLAAPLTIYLGLDDNDPEHHSLDKSESAAAQGQHRLERGRNCHDFAQKLAAERGWPFHWRKVEVAGIGHDGKAMLAAPEAEEALFGEGK